jgi:hypothetical protein
MCLADAGDMRGAWTTGRAWWLSVRTFGHAPPIDDRDQIRKPNLMPS